jgi:RNA polymerase sigma-70 factor (ECF subfamily)
VQPLSDEAVLAGVAAGDSDAAAVLVRRFQARVYGLARSIVGDAQLAEDVAQEAFVRAWRHAPSYDPYRGAVAPWLLTITRNVALDLLRSRRVRPTEPLEGHVARLLSEDGLPDDLAVASADARRVVTALAALPEGQRRAVVLASYGGRTAQEVGEIDGIPLGTAKTRIRQGLRRLRETLAVDDPLDEETFR